MQDVLLNYPNLRVVEASVEDIILDGSEKVQGIQVQDGTQHYLQHRSLSDFFSICLVKLYLIVGFGGVLLMTF